MRSACEKANRVLSSSFETTVVIDYLFEGMDFSSTLTRSRFEKLNMDLFEDCIQAVGNCLKDVEVSKEDIDDVVLIGGSTRIPKIQKMLEEFFNVKELCRSINPDEAAAYGAALHAASLSGVGVAKTIVLLDVTPLSLGLGVADGSMMVVIPRNTPIPSPYYYGKWNSNFLRQYDQSDQGERLKAVKNRLLATFSLEGIKPVPKGEAKFENIFSIDGDGILTESKRVLGTNNKTAVSITDYHGRLSSEEIESMVKRAEQLRAEDKEYVKERTEEMLWQ